MKNIVRILEIELEGFKNVRHGIIQMPSAFNKNYFNCKSDLLGIYGQNGSGKTAVIEAMSFTAMLLQGEMLPERFHSYISKDEHRCTIRVRFSIEAENRMNLADYIFTVEANGEGFEIAEEAIASAKWNGEKFGSKKTLLKYNSKSEYGEITPKFRYEEVLKHDKDNRAKLTVAKLIAQKEHSSFFFGNEGRKVFDAGENEYASIIKALRQYAVADLFVIESEHSGAISMNFVIPLSFRMPHEGGLAKGDLPIRLDAPSIIRKAEWPLIERLIREMNIVLCTIIPDMSIEIKNYGEQLRDDGEPGVRIELLSKRGSTLIPLRCESEGVLKIISILNVLMCVYNNPGTCLVIDELDSGIFEFLLGEILAVLDKGAKGQIIFTSHNLRALEMIKRENLVFSTTNPDCRYIHLQNVKKNNNIRDLYLRTITLGGQKEEIYAPTDSVDIGRAFRRAGKVALDGEEN